MVQKTFQCTICDGRFSTKTELIQHCEQHKVPQYLPYVGSGTYNILGNVGIRIVESYEPRTVEVYQPRTVEACQPRTVEASKPRTVEASKPRTVEACQPRTVEAYQPHTDDAYEPSYSEYQFIRPTFPCNFCTKIFKTRQTLTNHLSKHTGLYMYSCKTCNKGFNAQAPYVKHLTEHAINAKAQHPQ